MDVTHTGNARVLRFAGGRPRPKTRRFRRFRLQDANESIGPAALPWALLRGGRPSWRHSVGLAGRAALPLRTGSRCSPRWSLRGFFSARLLLCEATVLRSVVVLVAGMVLPNMRVGRGSRGTYLRVILGTYPLYGRPGMWYIWGTLYGWYMATWGILSPSDSA